MTTHILLGSAGDPARAQHAMRTMVYQLRSNRQNAYDALETFSDRYPGLFARLLPVWIEYTDPVFLMQCSRTRLLFVHLLRARLEQDMFNLMTGDPVSSLATRLPKRHLAELLGYGERAFRQRLVAFTKAYYARARPAHPFTDLVSVVQKYWTAKIEVPMYETTWNRILEIPRTPAFRNMTIRAPQNLMLSPRAHIFECMLLLASSGGATIVDFADTPCSPLTGTLLQRLRALKRFLGHNRTTSGEPLRLFDEPVDCSVAVGEALFRPNVRDHASLVQEAYALPTDLTRLINRVWNCSQQK